MVFNVVATNVLAGCLAPQTDLKEICHWITIITKHFEIEVIYHMLYFLQMMAGQNPSPVRAMQKVLNQLITNAF